MQENIATNMGDYRWHHSIDLGNGTVTPGTKSREACLAEARAIFDRVNVKNRTVLDIGAWNGFFSFEAKGRGASRVLATDSYCWEHPDVRGRESFDFARNALGLDIEARQIDIANISPETVGTFDVVLYLGVFYHRYDAIETLAKAASVAERLLVVETHLDLRQLKRPAMMFYPGTELSGDPTNWWGPNEHCVEALLRKEGFSEIEIAAGASSSRGIFHAWRSTDLRIRPISENEKLKSKKSRSKIGRELTRPFERLFDNK